MTRVIVCVLVVACAVLFDRPASARGRQLVSFRVDLRTGKVEARSQPAVPPGAPWPAQDGDPRRWIAYDKRTVVVYQGDPRVPATRKVRWQFTLPGSGDGWMPWLVLQGNTVAVAWREEVPDRRNQYRDIVQAIDMPTRKVLWMRVDPSHDPPAATGVGADHLVIDQDSEVLLLETRTGRVVRRVEKNEAWFAVASPRPGCVWAELGAGIECIDEGKVGRRSKQGQLLLVPIPGSDDWLVKTVNHTVRLNAVDGHQVWSAPSTSAARPLPSGDRIYEATLTIERAKQRAQMSLVARDLRTGKVVREYPVGRHDAFFDQATVAVGEARDGWVEVTGDFVVLD